MLLGIDIGTSSVKVALSEGDGQVASGSAPLAVSSPRPGWSEQPPDSWWDALRSALGSLDSESPGAISGVKAIGLSGQMHGLVALGDDRRPLRPCILWNDNRSAAECRILADQVGDIGAVAGVPPLPGFTAPKVMWVKRREPEVYRRIRHVLLPKDYVGMMLHGGIATDRSDAAGTLWLNQAKREWSERLCEGSGTDSGWLPGLHDGDSRCGEVSNSAAADTGLPAGIPVFAGGGDAATGAVAAGATEPGRGIVSLGTSGQLLMCTAGYSPNPEKLVHAFAHTIPDLWYQMAAMLNGARPLSWMAGVLGTGVGDVLRLSENADPDRIPLFLPYLTGERSPHGDPDIRGTFYGLEDQSGAEEMCRAVVESIGFSMADARESFGDAVSDAPHLLALGGGAASDAVLQAVSNATGMVLGRADGSAAGPAMGAALLAGAGAGILDAGALGRQPEVRDWFEPEPEQGTLPDRLAAYRSLYQALRPFARDALRIL